MPARRCRRTAREPDRLPSIITFRLEAELCRPLVQRAVALGVSPHELARHYVLAVLQEPAERTALLQALGHLGEQVTGSREDIALAVEALLASAGKVTAEEARAYVLEHFP